jgi:hypothetical protein
VKGIAGVIRGARVSVGGMRRVSAMGAVEHFDFSFDPSYRSAARLFGIRPATAWVEVSDQRLEARFGPWRVSTPLSNVVDAVTTGPYAFLKTAGPARLAITDRGLTFATTGKRGVRIRFARPVRGLDPLGLVRHPELTVTVRESDRLAALLNERRRSSGS